MKKRSTLTRHVWTFMGDLELYFKTPEGKEEQVLLTSEFIEDFIVPARANLR